MMDCDGVGIQSFVAGDCHSVEPIRHADVFAFVDNFESDLTEGANDPIGREVGNGIYTATCTSAVILFRVSFLIMRR